MAPKRTGKTAVGIITNTKQKGISSKHNKSEHRVTGHVKEKHSRRMDANKRLDAFIP